MVFIKVIICLILTVIVLIWYLKKLSQKDNPRLFSPFIRQYSRIDNNKDNKGCDIVFTGSSVVKFWESMELDLFPLKVINRGVAGTKINEINYWIKELVLKYRPKIVVLYAGSNDIQGKKPHSAENVLKGFVEFVKSVQLELPGLPIVFLSIIPSPAKTRWENWPEIDKANKLIGEYCSQDMNLYFINTTDRFLQNNGLPDNQFFRKDGIHLNESGYRIWQSELKPLLDRILNQYYISK